MLAKYIKFILKAVVAISISLQMMVNDVSDVSVYVVWAAGNAFAGYVWYKLATYKKRPRRVRKVVRV